MATNTTQTVPEKASTTNTNDVRPAYIRLGTDATGASHVYRTTDETVHVVIDGEREHVADVADRPVDDWMAFIRDRRGWATERYGVGLVDMLARAEGQA